MGEGADDELAAEPRAPRGTRRARSRCRRRTAPPARGCPRASSSRSTVPNWREAVSARSTNTFASSSLPMHSAPYAAAPRRSVRWCTLPAAASRPAARSVRSRRSAIVVAAIALPNQAMAIHQSSPAWVAYSSASSAWARATSSCPDRPRAIRAHREDLRQHQRVAGIARGGHGLLDERALLGRAPEWPERPGLMAHHLGAEHRMGVRARQAQHPVGPFDDLGEAIARSPIETEGGHQASARSGSRRSTAHARAAPRLSLSVSSAAAWAWPSGPHSARSAP